MESKKWPHPTFLTPCVRALRPRPHEQKRVLYWKCDKKIAYGQIICQINCPRIWEVAWLLLKALTGLSGPTANPQKNEQCSPAARMHIFRSESNIKKATYLSRRESFLSSKETYLSSREIYLSGGKNIVEKRRLIFSCVRGLRKYFFALWPVHMVKKRHKYVTLLQINVPRGHGSVSKTWEIYLTRGHLFTRKFLSKNVFWVELVGFLYLGSLHVNEAFSSSQLVFYKWIYFQFF